MKKRRLLFAIVLSFFLFTPKAYAVNSGVVTIGDDIEGDHGYVELRFYDNNNAMLAAIWAGQNNIIFGEMPQNIIQWTITGHESDTDYPREKFFDYILDYSKYWEIVGTSFDTYGGYPAYSLIPVANPNYQKPTFSITCNKMKISFNESADCTLDVTYYERIENISFRLNTKFEVSNVEAGEYFDNLNSTNEIYSLIGRDTMNESLDGNKITIIKFKIRGIENQTDDTIISASSIHFSDSNSEHEEEFASADVQLINDSNKNIENNPYTTNGNLYYVLLLLGITMICSLTLIKKININSKG